MKPATVVSQGRLRGKNIKNMATEQHRQRPIYDSDENEDHDSTTLIRWNNFDFCGFSLKIARMMDPRLGISSYIWDAGISLCQYFEKEDVTFTGKKVIELGSGTGIVGILAALLGGHVTITDKPDTLKQINSNISINVPFACRHRLKVRPLTWGEDQTKFPTDYDFILGSDIVYSSVCYPALLETLRYLCNQGTTIYLSSELRTGNGSIPFHDVILPDYFNCEVVTRLEPKCIAVYKLTKIGTGHVRRVCGPLSLLAPKKKKENPQSYPSGGFERVMPGSRGPPFGRF
ncbi:EEF1A lysine methyltransferase 3-like [Pristis pectinata]|uniref:EEF1A lysine methyltransferase 3-like n=1 Tax=Pristis pectinata TaxID=685728 RepID=UPI00223E34BC|nr:EEF1A lysine methyltransferase 3-like [Pristis pectinata]